MQHRVLGAADVLVDVHPAFGATSARPRRVAVVRVEVAQIVPRRFEERVHRVALAARRSAARGHVVLTNVGHARQRRAFAGDRHVGGEQHRQSVVGHGHLAALLAVHDRNRRAPIALARHEPIAQAVVDGLARRARRASRRCAIASRARSLDMPVKSPLAISRPSSTNALRRRRVDRSAVRRHDHLRDRQPCFLREIEVALVVRGHAHDRAGAVLGQHVVRHPDRHAFVRERIDRVGAGEQPLLLHQARALEFRFDREAVGERLDRRARASSKRSSSSRSTTGCSGAIAKNVAPKSVSTRVVKTSIFASSPSTPNANCAPSLRPIQLRCIVRVRSGQPVEFVDIVQQAVRVVGDLQEPLREVAALDQVSAAPAPAVDDLLVREHGLVVRAPVDRRFALVGQPVFVQAQEQPLVPAVVLRFAASRFRASSRSSCPSGGSGGCMLAMFDSRPRRRIDAARDRRVFGGQAERVPAHRVQHVVAEHAHHARDRVAERVVLGVADVQIARRIRQHLEHVVLRARIVVGAR